MNQMIENLIGLQALEVSDEKGPSGPGRIKEMRQRIPVPVLLHYDRLRARGKKGVVLVQNGVCRQCHIQVATGLLASLQRIGVTPAGSLIMAGWPQIVIKVTW